MQETSLAPYECGTGRALLHIHPTETTVLRELLIVYFIYTKLSTA